MVGILVATLAPGESQENFGGKEKTGRTAGGATYITRHRPIGK